MFLHVVQKKRPFVRLIDYSIQFVLPGRLQMSSHMFCYPNTKSPKTWARHSTANLHFSRMPAWTALVEKVSKWGQNILIHEDGNLHGFSSVSFKISLRMTDSLTFSRVFIVPIITGRKDRNRETTSSQPHLWNVCRIFAKLIGVLSVFCMKQHAFIPNIKGISLMVMPYEGRPRTEAWQS